MDVNTQASTPSSRIARKPARRASYSSEEKGDAFPLVKTVLLWTIHQTLLYIKLAVKDEVATFLTTLGKARSRRSGWVNGFSIDISDDAIANPCPIPISKFLTCQKNFGCSNELVSCGSLRFFGMELRTSDAQIIEHLKKIIACQTSPDLNDRPNIKRTMHFENMCCPT